MTARFAVGERVIVVATQAAPFIRVNADRGLIKVSLPIKATVHAVGESKATAYYYRLTLDRYGLNQTAWFDEDQLRAVSVVDTLAKLAGRGRKR